jgi:uncharacterized repeat protein (TIGR03803 family)
MVDAVARPLAGLRCGFLRGGLRLRYRHQGRGRVFPTLAAKVRASAVGSLFVLLGQCNSASARQFELLYSFCSLSNCADGSRPAAGLVADQRGVLYGTTNTGGASNNGAAFKLTPPTNAGGQWTETLLYSFCSLAQCGDGYNPAFRLLRDRRGVLFGTVPYGGSHNGGAAFKLTPPTMASGPWIESVLYSFCALPNCADGLDPQSDLIADSHGSLYGATQFGPGSAHGGTIFKLTPPAIAGGPWTETVLYTFCSLSNCADGDGPRAGLLLDHQGALYGTAQYGGIHGGGGVFKLIPPSMTGGLWAQSVLYQFCSVTNCTDGAVPQANLIMDAHGAIYGTTVNGGVFPVNVAGGSPSQGTVFKLTPPTRNGSVWTLTVLYRFCSQPYCADGSLPTSGLVMDQHGALFGTTQSGGSDGRSGTIFKLTSPVRAGDLWTETVLHSFCSLPDCADGFQPNGDLVMHEGALYGTTDAGGSNGGGTVFKLTLR